MRKTPAANGCQEKNDAPERCATTSGSFRGISGGSEIVLEYQGQERRIALDARFGPTEKLAERFASPGKARRARSLPCLLKEKRQLAMNWPCLTAASPC